MLKVSAFLFPSSRASWAAAHRNTWRNAAKWLCGYSRLTQSLPTDCANWPPLSRILNNLLFVKPVPGCWCFAKGLVTAVPAGEWESCCLQQEMFLGTDQHQWKLYNIPTKNEMDLNVWYKWGWLVDFKETKNLFRSCILATGNGGKTFTLSMVIWLTLLDTFKRICFTSCPFFFSSLNGSPK